VRKDIRLLAIELLKSLKKHLRYRELRDIFNLPPPIIWRYIQGEVLPSPDRANEILNTIISKKVTKRIIEKEIEVYNGVVATYKIIYKPSLLKLIGYEAYIKFKDLEPTAVVTAEVDGIPVALAIADYFDAKVAIAKRRKEVGFRTYIEYSYLSHEPPSITTLYLPSTLITRKDKVLIVDDVLRTGRTLRALIYLTKRTGASIVGVFSVIAVGSRWHYLTDEVKRIEIIHQVEREFPLHLGSSHTY